jgi:RND family efflux transporter MFP subunit
MSASAPIASVLVAVALLALPACNEAGGQAKTEPKPDRPVLVTPVRYAPLSPERSFVATIRPRVETEQGFRIGGKVVRRLVEVSDRVRAGQTLALLDETDLRLQVEQAEADIRALDTAVVQADSEEQRVVSLRKQGWSTDSSFDRQRAATDDVRARLDRAQRTLALARNALAYATLQADSDGVVTASLVEPGQVVAAGQTALRIAREGEKEAVIAVPEALVARIGEQRASLSLWSAPERPLRAELRELSPAADAATRTYTARFSLPDADASVKLGMTATVTLSEQGGGAVARLPLSALFSQGTGASVWTVSADGALSLRPVEVAAYDKGEVLVKSGVEEGERVVSLGVQKLDRGQRVRVVDTLGL